MPKSLVAALLLAGACGGGRDDDPFLTQGTATFASVRLPATAVGGRLPWTLAGERWNDGDAPCARPREDDDKGDIPVTVTAGQVTKTFVL